MSSRESGLTIEPITNGTFGAIVNGVKLWNRFRDQLANIKTRSSLKSFLKNTVNKTIPV